MKNPSESSPKTVLILAIVRTLSALAILALGIFVALSPGISYAPVPRITLLALVALLPAILLGTEAGAKLKLRLPGIALVAFGSIAVFFTALWILTQYSKPEQQIAVFYIVDQQHQPINNLDRDGALEVLRTSQGLSVNPLIDGNAMVLIFPEQITQLTIVVRPVSFGPSYSGTVTYAGNRQTYLVLDKDLLRNQ